MKDAYLDNAATAQPYPEVVETVSDALKIYWGNPSSMHGKGNSAKRILEDSRVTVASALKVCPEEVFFTSGGTESNNLAIAGSCMARQYEKNSIIISSLEHPSVTKTVRNFRRIGWGVRYIEAPQGNFDMKQLLDALTEKVALISITSVQNETGYRFPIKHISHMRNQAAPEALFHTDAVQAFGKVELYPHSLGVDLASISGHKIGGPKGVGALFVSKGVQLFSTALGGGQERGLRSGTEPLPLIAGFAKAVEITMHSREQTERHVRRLSQYLIGLLVRNFDNVIINSRDDGSPYILNFTIPHADNKTCIEKLSNDSIFISAASACASNHDTVPYGTWRKKHPLSLQLAGIPKHLIKNTFRVSFYADNAKKDVDRLIASLVKTVRNRADSHCALDKTIEESPVLLKVQ
jgi:cysteine desulfurase